jgi:hypothetical protein
MVFFHLNPLRSSSISADLEFHLGNIGEVSKVPFAATSVTKGITPISLISSCIPGSYVIDTRPVFDRAENVSRARRIQGTPISLLARAGAP